jgi:hypothetical protein
MLKPIMMADFGHWDIEDKIKVVRETAEKDDKGAIEAAVAELSTSLQKIGEIMQKAAEDAAKAPAGEAKEAEPTVHEADVNENKDAT